MVDLPDGSYPLDEIREAIIDSFDSERDLCDFIERNIINFTNDCLGMEYAAHEREFVWIKASILSF